MNKNENNNWLQGAGEMKQIIRSTDWSAHPLGPVSSWPQTLKTALGICLNSKFPMLVWWGKDLFVFYNDTYIPFCGLKHPLFLGKPAREQWAEIWESLEPLTRQVLTTGHATWAQNMQLFMNRRGFCEETYFTFSYSPIIDETNEVVGIINPCQETTEQVLSERRFKLLQSLSAKEVNSIKEIGEIVDRVLFLDNEDIPFSIIYLTSVDQKSVHLVGNAGVGVDSMLAPGLIAIENSKSPWPVADLYKEKKPMLLNNLRKLYKDALPQYPYEEMPDAAYLLPIEIVGKDMPSGFIVLGISPRLMFDELYQGFFELISRQISIHISNSHTLAMQKQRVEELSELNKAKTDFFNNVSHELRTPLTLIVGPLENLLAKSSGLTASAKNEIDLIYRNAVRLIKLVNNLLNFSRIESHRIDVKFESLDLCKITSTIANSFLPAIEKAGLKFIINCQPLSRETSADKEMWENIVINLLSNAFKYTLQGTISISLREVNDDIELTVKDTGVGIPKADIAKIFERFYRVKGTQGRTHEGTGIGLSLVKELITIHGGTITVDSEVGMGTVFTVKIPIVPIAATNKISKPAADTNKLNLDAFVQEAMSLVDNNKNSNSAIVSASQNKVGSVYIVEDNADMREYMTNLLKDQYDVTSYANGKVALERILQQAPDVVLSDVMMPVMDGLELIKQIRATKSVAKTPVILISARAGQEASVTGIDAGADDYLVKPFSARELIARVRQHMNMQHLRAETDKMKESFLASITHELRSPLTAIIGYLSLMHSGETGPLSAKQQEDISYVIINAEHLLHLVNQLLDLAKIEAGKIEFFPERVDLKELVNEVTRSMYTLMQEKKS